MNGKIQSDGMLRIERAGNMKIQYCPLSPEMPTCGDWCPLFGEPTTRFDFNNKPKGCLIELCNNRTLFLDTFTDERGTHP